jgi:hypothetical protein
VGFARRMTTMAEEKAKDPGAGWRDMVAQWEKGINTLANQTMASDEFSSGANSAMNVALRAQQVMGAAMSTYLATLNLPSRADVVAISDRLQVIESYMSRIANVLEAQQPAASKRTRRPSPAAKPRRTKRPPGEAWIT